MNIYTIGGLIISFLIIGEYIYIKICKDSYLKDVEDNWFLYKIMSLLISLFGMGIVWVIIGAIKEHLYESMVGIIATVLIISFLMLNRKIGLHFAKKNKPKTKSKKNKAK